MNVYPVLLLILVLLQAMASDAGPSNPRCIASSCGDVHNISYPFRLKSDPKGCGNPKNELVCENNRIVMYLLDGQFYVQSINYSTYQIILVDDELQKDNCSFLPHYSWWLYDLWIDPNNVYNLCEEAMLVIVNCSKPVNSLFYISTSPCIEGLYSSNTSSNWNLYALLNPNASDVRDFCTISSWTQVSDDFGPSKGVNISFYNYKLIHKIMADGFALSFDEVSVKKTYFFCFDFYGYFHFDCHFDSFRIGGHNFPEIPVCGFKLHSGGKNWLAMKTVILHDSLHTFTGYFLFKTRK